MLSVTIEDSGSIAVLHCSGRLVAGEEAWILFNTVSSLENKSVVVLDLTRVSRADAHGLGALAFLRQWANIAGVRLQLTPSKTVQELLDLTGLSSELELRPAEDVQPFSDFFVDSHEESAKENAADD
jgi:anti-anti-sigma factor